MFSQNVSNAVVHQREILRAVCEIARIWLPRELVYVIFRVNFKMLLLS